MVQVFGSHVEPHRAETSYEDIETQLNRLNDDMWDAYVSNRRRRIAPDEIESHRKYLYVVTHWGRKRCQDCSVEKLPCSAPVRIALAL